MTKTVEDILAKHGVEIADDALEHAGVKGMRWGKRKKKQAADEAEAEAAKPKVKDMSDTELKAKINRLKLEKEYASLTAPQVSQGRKIVADLLLESGKKAAKNYVDRELESLISGGAKATAKAVAKSVAKSAAKESGRQVVQFARRPGF